MVERPTIEFVGVDNRQLWNACVILSWKRDALELAFMFLLFNVFKKSLHVQRTLAMSFLQTCWRQGIALSNHIGSTIICCLNSSRGNAGSLSSMGNPNLH